ncbi:MAG: ATP-binding protein [Paracoccaceae bacterium]
MLTSNILIAASIAYVSLLFIVAFWAERRAERGQLGWLRSPLVYTLSISVYCTAWTFYGAVGSAARNGLEFVTIYLGPTLVFIGWWWILRKLLRIGRTQRITSIADLISSRYGKSATLGVAVTLLAVIGSTPYIALQLQSITTSFSVFSPDSGTGASDGNTSALWIAAVLALFTILFGTRNVDANERHHGVVTAIALEAVVKLFALLAVGIFVVWGIGNGPTGIFAHMSPEMLHSDQIFSPRWVALTFLSATAIITLPRMFQVTIVENADERHLSTASWAFPAYLFLMSLFVLPIAIAGQYILPPGSNPDLFVLTVPLAEGQNALALFAFLGGFSSATSMVIIATIALSTMVSNHIVMPLWLGRSKDRLATSGDVRRVLLLSRRLSIAGLLLLGYFYFRLTGGSGALASIGLISFAGVAQILPSLLGGIFWRGATRTGALTGLAAGFILWAYTLFLPSFEGAFILSAGVLENGLFGHAWLRPQELLGLTGYDPLVHSMLWSLSVNTALFIGLSLIVTPNQLERIQGAQFVDVFRQTGPGGTGVLIRRSATSEDLFTLAQRILGTTFAHRLFTQAATEQNKTSGLPDPTDTFIERLERELTGSVGAASAHAMVSQIAGGGTVSVEELLKIADETAQIMEYSQQLETQSRELSKTASKLRKANAQLTELGAQKDAFLSQISHELRTPMTSIRSFAEILRDERDIASEQAQRFVGIINTESQRLTRLLDEILDLSLLESGRINWQLEPVSLDAAIAHALTSSEGVRDTSDIKIIRKGDKNIMVMADFDRLAQVFINLLSNAIKYGRAENPQITIRTQKLGKIAMIGVTDNGAGIRAEDREKVFEKFSRLSEITLAGSAGLGLPISREIMRNLNGELSLEENAPGAVFRVTLPLV